MNKEEEERFKKLEMRCEKLETEMGEFKADMNYQIAVDRESIKLFRDYRDLKRNGRKSFDELAIQLKDEVLRRDKGLDYMAIVFLFDFHSHEEAYRLMDRTIKNFPLDTKIVFAKNSRKKKTICKR